MTKYVIDLPAAATVIVAKKRFLLNETDVMRVPVSQLEMYVEPTVAENATVEKRVIELPADSIAWLERMKSNLETIDVYDLLNNVLDDNSGSYHAYQFNFNSETDELNTLAEWLLGHVEFVPKKEQRFHVMTDFGTLDARDEHGETLISFETLSFLKHHGHYYEFSEADADKLVAGLSALKARKVKVKE
ncbi:hypothetical protein EFL69_04560 [Weissella confusa]|uniref:hypothetical protein n=1 Tax=Weissella confusa TaxID=1583 RepID=UPI00223B2ACC|nr:hypothetical protein [Weissella confusa]MCS9992374.1 hypothetical protein [Weissella confusa]